MDRWEEECLKPKSKDLLIKKYTWRNKSGLSVSVISYGAAIQSIQFPDKNGTISDLVMGFDGNLSGYVERNTPYFGVTVGRCANRIKGASFEIDHKKYKLANNIGSDHLHGGIMGFDKVNWQSSVEDNMVTFSYLSKDGEEGYPGDLVVNVTYQVIDNGLKVEFLASTTKSTVVNLTNHSYFNLAGHNQGAEELYKHKIEMNADRITETDSDSIPTGRLVPVGGTHFDLRIARRLGDILEKNGKLFDDNFCVSSYRADELNYVARVYHEGSGRHLELYSDQPGVQVYTGNSLPPPSEAAIVGKENFGYRRHGAFCLETQNYPDAVHHQNFPSPILKPGVVYRHTVLYKFGVASVLEPSVVVG